MVVSRMVSCLIIALTFQGILGATLHDSKEGQMMRHERKEANVRMVEMSAHGDFLVNESDASESSAPAVAGIVKGASGNDFCDYDYTFGKQNSNFCDNRSTTDMSDLRDRECIFAATESGAKTPTAGFEIPQEWDDVRPKGCYAFPCQHNEGEWCYFENEDGAIPSKNLTGYPICRRWRYLNGHAIANATVDDERMCPHSEYEVVAGQDACRRAASCLGDCAGDEFRIGIHNASKHGEFPPGCFMHAKDSNDRSCVYWNDPEKSKLHPEHPKGTPICIVKGTDHVSSLGNSKDHPPAESPPAESPPATEEATEGGE